MAKTVRPSISSSSAACTSAFGLGIQRAGRLVQNQDRRVAQHGPRDGEALPLAARHAHAALPDHRVVALRHLLDELVRHARSRAAASIRSAVRVPAP